MFLHTAAHLAGEEELFPNVLDRRSFQGVPISLMLIGMSTSSNILLTFEIFQLLDLIYCDKKGMVVLFFGKRLKSKTKPGITLF